MSSYSSVRILLDSLTNKQEETIVQNDEKKNPIWFDEYERLNNHDDIKNVLFIILL